MAVNLEVVYEHIRVCLKIGDRKLQSAKSLKESRKFEDAIPLYVKAYEELGQASFFRESYSKNPEITQGEWNILVKPGSHTTKILAFYIAAKNSLQKMTDDEFDLLNKSEFGRSFLHTGNRETLLNDTEMKIRIFSKLDKLRQRFDHSHELDGTIVHYGEKDLESFCELLEFECLKSYHTTRFWLDYKEAGLPANFPDEMVDEISNRMTSLPTMTKLKELDHIGNSIRLRKHRTRGLIFMDSFKAK